MNRGRIHRTGCPLCGAPITTWTLDDQLGHMEGHPWWRRLALERKTRLPLGVLLTFRKYRTTPD